MSDELIFVWIVSTVAAILAARPKEQQEEKSSDVEVDQGSVWS